MTTVTAPRPPVTHRRSLVGMLLRRRPPSPLLETGCRLDHTDPDTWLNCPGTGGRFCPSCGLRAPALAA